MNRTKPRNQEIADAFLADVRWLKTLIYVREWNRFCIFTNGYYRQIPSEEMSRIVLAYIREQHGGNINITMSLVGDIIEQLKGTIIRAYDQIDSQYIAFNDTLYNLETFNFEEFDTNKIALHHIGFDSSKLQTTATPIFTNFLASTLVDKDGRTDKELVDLCQQMIGYYLINNLKAQVVFFLVGRGSNGKSVLIHLIEKIIGKDYVSAMTIQSLTTDKFATSGLIGKKVNICNEEESKFLRSDKFKALVSGDLIHAERKHEREFFFHPKTKYLFATNRLPSFDAINYGIRRRMRIIPFNRVFKENEQDWELPEKLIPEIPGIVAWGLEGAKSLIGNGYRFIKSKSVEQASIEFENITSSSLMFFRENFVISNNENMFLSNEDMYAQYVDWCRKNGRREVSEHNFREDIKDNIFDGKPAHIKWSNGINKRGRQVEPLIDIDLSEKISHAFD